MTLLNDKPRCTGRYDNQHGEFGSVINQECIGCQRRINGYPAGHWYMQVPEFEGECPSKIKETS